MTSGERGPEVKILRLRNILTSDSQEEPAGATGGKRPVPRTDCFHLNMTMCYAGKVRTRVSSKHFMNDLKKVEP